MLNGSLNFVTFWFLLVTGVGGGGVGGLHEHSLGDRRHRGGRGSTSPVRLARRSPRTELRDPVAAGEIPPRAPTGDQLDHSSDSIPSWPWVHMRIRSTSFSAESTLTHDTVPVNVDAVMFWVVTDAQRAILEVARFLDTVSWAAQTTLRDVIGKSELVRMIADRQALDRELQAVIDTKTTEWGITVQSVEIRDVQLPSALGRRHEPSRPGRPREGGSRNPRHFRSARRGADGEGGGGLLREPLTARTWLR